VSAPVIGLGISPSYRAARRSRARGRYARSRLFLIRGTACLRPL